MKNNKNILSNLIEKKIIFSNYFLSKIIMIYLLLLRFCINNIFFFVKIQIKFVCYST